MYNIIRIKFEVMFFLICLIVKMILIQKKIKLKQPWHYGTKEKGTKLSQSYSGPTYNYGVINKGNIINKYQYYENYIEGVKGAELLPTNRFRPATKYIKILILINCQIQSLI